MNSKIKISVIVPFHNVQEYIAETIQSICNQSLKNIEIILINDHSSDESYNTALNFSEKYNNVSVHQSLTEGVSAARNLGLEYSTGEYIFFIDSDDLLPNPDTLNLLYNVAIKQDADIVMGLHERFNGNHRAIASMYQQFPSLTKEGVKTLKNNPELIYPIYCWGKLFKKELIENIRFLENISFGEDQPFTIYTYLNAKRIYSVSEIVYSYRVREGQLTQVAQKKSDKHLENLLYVLNASCNYFDLFIQDKHLRLDLYAYYFNRVLLWNISSSVKEALTADQSIQTRTFELLINWLESLDSSLFKSELVHFDVIIKLITTETFNNLDPSTKELCRSFIEIIETKTNHAEKNGKKTRHVVLKDHTEMIVLNNDFIGDYISLNYDYYERDELDYFFKYYSDKEVIYDIGANIGNHTVFFAKYGNVESIYAFEPIKELVILLNENIRGNQVEQSVKVIETALSCISTKGRMQLIKGNIGASTLVCDQRGEITVEILDTLNLPVPEFIKIDVGDHEFEVLRGMENLLINNSPLLWVHIRTENLLKVNEFLNNLNYEMIDRYLSNSQYSNFIYKKQEGFLLYERKPNIC